VSRITQEGERLCRGIRLSLESPPLGRISTEASGLAGPTRLWPRNPRAAWRIERIEWWTAECSRRANDVKVDGVKVDSVKGGLAIVNSPTDRPARSSAFALCASQTSNSTDAGELPMNFFAVFQIAR
jgi:hypothetical protein